MAGALRRSWALRLLIAVPAVVAGGCQLVPREQVEECHRLSQTLRSENARLKDQMLALRSDNQDLAERAVDDARRLSQLETARERLESSVQAYQDERSRIEAAYNELRASLPASLRPAAIALPAEDRTEPRSPAPVELDRSVKRTGRAAAPQTTPRRKRASSDARTSDGWAPSPSKSSGEPSPEQAPLTWD
jgi:hypothetical protein